MKQELDDKLCMSYPEIFRDRYAAASTTSMCWGFECGDGWYTLIDRLCNDITLHLSQYTKAEIDPVIATQVKEKFGGLRFYHNGGDAFVDAIVLFVESLSYKTCMFCGTTKNVGYTTGWITTCCENCFKTDDYFIGKEREWINGK
jgi:hypothetical protein